MNAFVDGAAKALLDRGIPPVVRFCLTIIVFN